MSFAIHRFASHLVNVPCQERDILDFLKFEKLSPRECLAVQMEY